MNGNAKRTLAHLTGLPLVEALWWLIENRNEDLPSEVFFALRERYRNEYQGQKQLTDARIAEIAEDHGTCTLIDDTKEPLWFDGDLTNFARAIEKEVRHLQGESP